MKKIVNPLPGEPRLEQLVLTVTERCNQRCTYCYVPRGGSRSMSLDVARRALDFFFAHAREGRKLSVAFFGGEPFLEPTLLRTIAREALRRAGNRQVELSTTTNGTAIDAEGLALVRDLGIKLAVSHDGFSGQRARPLASGEPSLPLLRENLEKLLAIDGAVAVARMSVTPESVSSFFDDLREVLASGIPSIQYLPVFEAAWDDLALRRWTSEHHRLVTWLLGRRGVGAPCPSLPAWRGILGRLAGRPRRHCGAGTTRLAVSVEGAIHPCYRSVFGAAGERLALGDVWSGITRLELRAAIAGLDPDGVRPEEGDCQACPARQGCGFFCPSLGALLCGDLGVVPRSACALTRGQVEACGRLAGAAARRTSRPVRAAWAAALAAAFIGSAAAGCSRPVGQAGDASVWDGRVEEDAVGPGVCPVGVDAFVDAGLDSGLDARPDAEADGSIGPGLCPMMLDGGLDAGPDAGCDPGYGGIC